MLLLKKIIYVTILMSGVLITFFYVYLNFTSFIKRKNVNTSQDLKIYKGKLLFANNKKLGMFEIGITPTDVNNKQTIILQLISQMPKYDNNVTFLKKAYAKNQTIWLNYDYAKFIWQVKIASNIFQPSIAQITQWHKKTIWFSLGGAITFLFIGLSFSYIFIYKKYMILKKEKTAMKLNS